MATQVIKQLDGSSQNPFEFDPAQDLPAWEQHSPAQAADRYPYGYLDLLTWHSRRLLCVPSPDRDGVPVVKKAVVARGWQFPAGFELRTRETMVPYQKRANASASEVPWTPLQLSRERVLWRDSIALLQQTNSSTQRPRSIEWFAHLQLNSWIPPEVETSLAVLGLLYDPRKTAEMWLWRHEPLPLPAAYLQDEELLAELQRAIELAETRGGG